MEKLSLGGLCVVEKTEKAFGVGVVEEKGERGWGGGGGRSGEEKWRNGWGGG